MNLFRIFITGLCITMPFAAVQANTDSALTGCDAKKQALEEQIAFAKAHDNAYRVSGLEKALSEVHEHCTNDLLLKKSQDKIREKKRKVKEREEELREAKDSGQQSKIAKKQKKLEEARKELDEVEKELTQ